ncbi:dCTP pyrophosphatase 1 [Ixodes scapularis]|uniref:dCTP pyrophosphatase 1 n=1 Tax=Ixodes scapularis TaxID=6945 RepID=UPI001A9EF3E1|nr:dCTP pyrophosphatase 1 [Ixodes scapularis]
MPSRLLKRSSSIWIPLCRRTMSQATNGSTDGKPETSQTSPDFSFGNSLSLESIRKVQEEFSKERNWDQYHSPRNILLAMIAEVGEVSECFQWKGEVKEGLPDWTSEEKTHLGEELSDVLIYLVRLADRCRIDLPSAVLRKVELNKQKYPASRVYGKSDKYTAYTNTE